MSSEVFTAGLFTHVCFCLGSKPLSFKPLLKPQLYKAKQYSYISRPIHTQILLADEGSNGAG